jgi:hypothetical protein
MKKRGARIKHRETHSPVLVALMLAPEVSLAERNAVDALTRDYADNGHFNVLWDCHAMLVFGGEGKPEVDAINEVAAMALANIRERWEKHGVVRATGDELAVLGAMVDFSEDFWKRSGGQRFDDAYKNVMACREMYRNEKAD